MSDKSGKQSLLSSALTLSGLIGQEREKQEALGLNNNINNKLLKVFNARCSKLKRKMSDGTEIEIEPTFHGFPSIPEDLQMEVLKYLNFVDLHSVFISSKYYASLPAKNNLLWQRVPEFCVENKRDFIERYSGMHSWYKHLGGGRDFHFVIRPSRLMRGYGDSVPKSDWMGNYGLHFHCINERYLSEYSNKRPWVTVNLNCFYGQRNPYIAVSDAKRVENGDFYQHLLEIHEVKAEDKLVDEWEYTILAKREYRRLANIMYDALCELEENVFSVPFDVP